MTKKIGAGAQAINVLGAQNGKVEKRPKRYICPECGKAYNRPSLLEQHARTHTGETPFQCEECDAAFTRKSLLTAHLLKHQPAAEKPFKCDECGKGVNTRQHLRQHMRLHLRPYACRVEGCSETFRMQIQLDRHYVQHEARCGQCGKQFRNAKALDLHIKRNHDSRYHCGVCEARFDNVQGLMEHVPSHAGRSSFALTDPAAAAAAADPTAVHTNPTADPTDPTNADADPTADPTADPDDADPTADPGDADPGDADPTADPDSEAHIGPSDPANSLDTADQARSQPAVPPTIAKLTGVGYDERPIGCPFECGRRFKRQYDLQRHVQSHHATASN